MTPPNAASNLPPLPASIQSPMAPVLRFLADLNPRMVQRHFDAGQHFFQQDLFWEAEQRWRWVLNLRPNFVPALVGTAWVLLLKERKQEALQLLQRALMLQPHHAEARYLLASATGCKQPEAWMPQTTPPRMIQKRYSMVAASYDMVKLVDQRYSAPIEIVSRMIETLGADITIPNILDIGCGTGIVGELGWRTGTRIEGVDGVASMLRQASRRVRLKEAQRNLLQQIEAQQENNPDITLPPDLQNPLPVYDALWNEDARDFLLRPRAPMFHAILACELFNEIGGLTPVFDGSVRNLLPGGVLVCSTDVGPEQGYHAYGEGEVRFAHSEAYLNDLAGRVGLNVISHSIGPRDQAGTVRYSIFRKER